MLSVDYLSYGNTRLANARGTTPRTCRYGLVVPLVAVAKIGS